MLDFLDIFGAPRALIGMVHLGALPGTPHHQHNLDGILATALAEAKAYQRAGFTALLLENMHDRPYLKGEVGPEITACMAVAARAIRTHVALPLGIQVLAGANREALAVALAGGASFIRAEGYVFGHLADEGYIDAQAGPLLRYRKQIGAEHIAVFCDLKKKHSSHALTADVDLKSTAEAAAFFGADGVIVTGGATGQATSAEEVRALTTFGSLPVMVGSGLTADNLADYRQASGFIVGSWVKEGGHWTGTVDNSRLAAMVEAFRKLHLDAADC